MGKQSISPDASFANVVAFIAVVTEGSFIRAGERLGVGRSAVSRSVQKLEETLDTRLFSRTTRSTVLTSEGEQFFAACKPAMEQIVQAMNDMRELRGGPPRGHLRVASTVGFGRNVVAPLLAGFQSTHPGISVELVLDDRTLDFTQDRVDVAFREGKLADSQIIAKQLAPLEHVLCASAEYVREHGAPLSVDELSQHQCVSLGMRDWTFKVDGVTRKLTSHGRLAFTDPDLVLRAILDGAGIAQLPGFLVVDHVRSARLVSLLPQHAPDDGGHHLCFASREHQPARIRAFVDYMTRAIRALDFECLARFKLG